MVHPVCAAQATRTTVNSQVSPDAPTPTTSSPRRPSLLYLGNTGTRAASMTSCSACPARWHPRQAPSHVPRVTTPTGWVTSEGRVLVYLPSVASPATRSSTDQAAADKALQVQLHTNTDSCALAPSSWCLRVTHADASSATPIAFTTHNTTCCRTGAFSSPSAALSGSTHSFTSAGCCCCSPLWQSRCRRPGQTHEVNRG